MADATTLEGGVTDPGEKKASLVSSPSEYLKAKAADEEGKKPLLELLLTSSTITALVTVVLGTILGGYLLERSKRNTAAAEKDRQTHELEAEKAKQKQEAVIKNQLASLDEFRATLAEYKVAAEFLVYDIVNRRGKALVGDAALGEAVRRYDAASRAMLIGQMRDLFRVRLYFHDETLYTALKAKCRNLAAVDGKLAVLITDYKDQGPNLDRASVMRWQDALSELRQVDEDLDSVLNQLADRTVAKQLEIKN